MDVFSLEGREFVTLNNLLKFQGWCESGGMAKQVIAAGEVNVDGEIERRKRCKIKADQIVSYADQSVQVLS